jgi:hypothetical protein
MRSYEAQIKDYKHYEDARRDFESFCTRAGLDFTSDDAAGGITSNFHIQITKLNIEHENNETNFYRTVNNSSNLNSGAEICRPLAKW